MDTKVEILYPAPMPPMTPEERAASDAAVAEAKASGHPLAQYAGTLPDDELTHEWMAAMREYRRQVEEDPNY